MDIVIATHNKKKLDEINAKIQHLNSIHLLSLDQFDNIYDIVENGVTFSENALIKASTVASITGSISLADDSGLVVDALDGRPGVKSARYGGPGLDDTGRNALLLEELTNVPAKNRTARFECVIAIVDPVHDKKYTVTGSCEGLITTKPQGTNGFGYDPLFFVQEYQKTMAQLAPEIKNSISHRALALDKAIKIIEKLSGK